MTRLDYRNVKPSTDPRFANIPGENGLPLFGQLFSVLYDLPNFVRSQHRKYGPVFRMNAGPEKMAIFISHFLRLYHFRTPPGYRPKFQYMPLSKIRDGLPLLLEPRQELA
jgi:hypothetical protein